LADDLKQILAVGFVALVAAPAAASAAPASAPVPFAADHTMPMSFEGSDATQPISRYQPAAQPDSQKTQKLDAPHLPGRRPDDGGSTS
jgi:hypothetical protein